MKHFLHTEPAYTKYRTVRRKTPRLKVIVYDIDEIWSIDRAYVDKLADYNKNIKSFGCSGLQVPLFTCTTTEIKVCYLNCGSIQTNVKNKTAKKKFWVDKGTEFKGTFKTLCEKKSIETYILEIEKKSAFAERNI